MWLLGQKDGKPWWHYRDAQDNWVPISEEEEAAQKKYWNNLFDEIAAKVFNDAFNKEQGQ